MTCFEAGVTGSLRDAPKENGYSAEGWKYRVHIKCMKESTKKAIRTKKLKKGRSSFFNTQ